MPTNSLRLGVPVPRVLEYVHLPHHKTDKNSSRNIRKNASAWADRWFAISHRDYLLALTNDRLPPQHRGLPCHQDYLLALTNDGLPPQHRGEIRRDEQPFVIRQTNDCLPSQPPTTKHGWPRKRGMSRWTNGRLPPQPAGAATTQEG